MTSVTPAAPAVDANLYAEISQFLFREARMLDERRYDEWLELFTDDVRYEMPLTLTRERSEDARAYDRQMGYFSENSHSLRMRVDRLHTEYAWAEDPPTRTRHLIANLEIYHGEDTERFEAHSVFVVYASRGDLSEWDKFLGARKDTVVRQDGQWRIADRLLLLDQSVLAANSISIFL